MSSMTIFKRRPGLGTMVLIGFFLGIACGLFFGELASVLNTLGRAYVRLLQMAIVPYIMVSLIAGLGRLTPSQASRIALWGGVVLLLILSVGMVLMLMVPLAYPDWEAASYFSSSLLSSPEKVDFVELYISANPFDSLANTVVPAVVLFSLVMGVAVMISERKGPLLDLLASLDEALINITHFVVKLAPIGIFAIAANAAGTLDLTAFDKLQVFVWSYLLLWAILFFILLPGLLVALTPLRYTEIFSAFRISFITAFVTGSVLVVLPMLIEEIRKLLKTHKIADEETDAAVNVLIPTTFNFPSVAMLLVLSFILFSAWYSGTPLPLDQYPSLASVGLFVAFGGSNIALPFLLGMFRLPADMFELFLVANVITNFFFMALAAMNLVVLTLLAMFLIKGRISIRPVPAFILLAILFVGTPILLKGTGMLIDDLIAYEYDGYQNFISRELSTNKVEVRDINYQSNLPINDSLEPRLSRIKSDGVLRVGHSPDSLPWAFRNEQGDAVGYDIELLHHLAIDLGVNIEIMRVNVAEVSHALASGQIDIYASGMIIDAGLEGSFDISQPYTQITLGLLVEDYRRQEFETSAGLQDLNGLSIAVLQSPLLLRALEIALPEVDLVQTDSPRDFLQGNLNNVDALVMSAEAASAWTLVYPEFSVVIPTTSKSTFPIVFGLAKSDEAFLKYINIWIQATSSLGLMDRSYQHWILGQDTLSQQPRWSIIRNVLHWLD